MVALTTMLVLEASARAISSALPAVDAWREPLMDAKIAQMNLRARVGGAQVVLAGSSQMLFAGDPRMLRQDLKLPWSIYNAGLWAASPRVNENWLLKFVLPRLHPKTVIWGVAAGDFTPSDRRHLEVPYFQAPAVRDDLLGRIQREVASRSAVVKYRLDLRDPRIVAASVVRRLRGQPGPALPDQRVDPSGRLNRADRMTFVDDAYNHAVGQALVQHGAAITADQRAAFERTVRAMRSQGIEVVIVQMPMSSALINLYAKSTDNAAIHDFLVGETAKLNVPLVNMADGLTDTHYFADFDHLNRAGDNVFNTALGRALDGGAPGQFTAALAQRVGTAPVVPMLAADALANRGAGAAGDAGSSATTVPAAPGGGLAPPGGAAR